MLVSLIACQVCLSWRAQSIQPGADAIDEVRALIARGETQTLAVDDLEIEDLARISWLGSSLHIKSVEENLRRSPEAVEYLCVRTPTGAPIAKGGVD